MTHLGVSRSLDRVAPPSQTLKPTRAAEVSDQSAAEPPSNFACFAAALIKKLPRHNPVAPCSTSTHTRGEVMIRSKLVLLAVVLAVAPGCAKRVKAYHLDEP